MENIQVNMVFCQELPFHSGTTLLWMAGTGRCLVAETRTFITSASYSYGTAEDQMTAAALRAATSDWREMRGERGR